MASSFPLNRFARAMPARKGAPSEGRTRSSERPLGTAYQVNSATPNVTERHAKWQATRPPPAGRRGGGSSAAQTSWASGQRVRKRQPVGISRGFGGSPSRAELPGHPAAADDGARRRGASACRDGAGPRTASAPSPSSTILPRYITATRWHIARTTARSWEMKRYVSANAACRRRKQLQHARLHGHVEPRGRLVEDDEARPQHEDAGESHAPLLAPGQLVRVEVEMRVGQAHRAQHRLDLGPARSARDSVVWIWSGSWSSRRIFQRGSSDAPGILVHVLQIAGNPPALAPGQPADLPPREADLARRRPVDAHHGLAEGRLSASALADEAERLARPHRE